MLTGFFVVLGGLMGAAMGEVEGCFFGAFVGYLLGHGIAESGTRRKLEARLQTLENAVALARSEVARVTAAQPRESQTQVTRPQVTEIRRPTAGYRPIADDPTPTPDYRPPSETQVVDRASLGDTQRADLGDTHATTADYRAPTTDGQPSLGDTQATTADYRPAETAGRRVSAGDASTNGRPRQPSIDDLPASAEEPRAIGDDRTPTPDYRGPRDDRVEVTEIRERPSDPSYRPPRSDAPSAKAPGGFDPIEAARAWLFGGNTVVRVGVIILLFGVGFLVKYAAEHAIVPIELRLIGAVLLGIGMLGVGFRVRTTRASYAVSLQGGGIGVIYLVTFAALKIYALIPAPAAFIVFVLLGIATAFLAIVQDAIALAVLGIIGGFLAPILASTGSGDHVGLFTYYALLNAGILGIAWFKSWRVLNLVGFTFTFIIGTAWGATAYKPENYVSAQAFLALFFVFYAAIAVIYALKRPTEHRGIIDGTLVFGLPAIAFGLQVGLVADTPWGLAISALVLAAFYVGVATIVWKSSPTHGRALAEAFTAIGVVFITMALPFALNAQWTAAAYALEGAGLVWIGRRQNKQLAVVAGVLLQFAAGVTFDTEHAAERSQPVLDIVYPYALLRALGAFASAYFLRTSPLAAARVATGFLVVWGLGWLTGGVAYDLVDNHHQKLFTAVFVAAIAAHAIILELLGKRLSWTAGRIAALALIPLMLGAFFIEHVARGFGETQAYAWVSWAFAVAVLLTVLYRQQSESYTLVVAIAYGVTPALLALIFGATAYVHVEHHVPEGFWAAGAATLTPTLLLATLLGFDIRDRWPMTTHRRAMLYGCEPIVAFLVFWSFVVSFTNSGNSAPLPYVPLLTPLDVTQAFIVVAGFAWALRMRARNPERFEVLRVPLLGLLATVLFVHLSAMCVRSVHHYADVPWDGTMLMGSTVVQTTLSIAWSVIALVVTALASRRGWRHVWMVGGTLLGVVVVKLFVVDLSSIGTVTRIVSFLAVGLLLLLIGWISPVPPRAANA